MENNQVKIRLNKYLSQIGYCSRRNADKLIKEGKNEIINETAFVTMGYLNQIHVYGIDKFIKGLYFYKNI